MSLINKGYQCQKIIKLKDMKLNTNVNKIRIYQSRCFIYAFNNETIWNSDIYRTYILTYIILFKIK